MPNVRYDAIDRVEAVVTSHPSVARCRVISKSRGETTELVAFVVADGHGPHLESDIEAYVAGRLPEGARPRAIVRLPALPLTAGGHVDDRELARFPLFDDELVRRCDEALRSRPGVRDVKVVVDRSTSRPPALHLRDIVPEWKRVDETATDEVALASSAAADLSEAPPAFASGGPLVVEDGLPLTLTAALLRTADRYAEKRITFVEEEQSKSTTYRQLLHDARCVLTQLRRAGLKRGDILMIQIPDLSLYFPLLWACLLEGIKPMTVAVPPTYDAQHAVVQKLRNAWELTGRPAIVTTPVLAHSIESLRERIPMPDLRVIVLESAGDEPASQLSENSPADVAFLQLSSGSTGMSKAIQITHKGIIAHVLGTQQAVGIDSSDVTLNWLPFDHVVPQLMFHMNDVYLGSEQIHVPGSMILARPLAWLDLIERYRVTHTWAPNFGFKLVADALQSAGARHWDLSSIKSFVNAGEQVTVSAVRAFVDRVRPFGVTEKAIQPAYGMAETCTCITYENDFNFETSVHRLAKSSLQGIPRPAAPGEDAATFVRCGPPSPGVSIRITDRDNRVLPEGMVGRLQVAGEVITPGYLNNPNENRDALVGGGWLNTGDLAFIKHGRLVIAGREKELIIINGANHYCYDLEDVVNGLDGVERTYVAACGVPDRDSGSESLAIFFVPTQDDDAHLVRAVAAIRRELASRVGVTPAFVVPIAKSLFPKTTSGKIQRARLKERLLSGDLDAELKRVDILLENANTVPQWFYRRSWYRSVADAQDSPAVVVILAQAGASVEALRARWSAKGAATAVVRPGVGFVSHGAREYQIDPTAGDDYRRVLADLGPLDGRLGLILHTWSHGEAATDPDSATVEQHVRRAANDILHTVQALAATRGPQDRWRVVVVSSHAQQVRPDDQIYAARAVPIALLKSASQELEWLECRHIDTEDAQDDLSVDGLIDACVASGPDVEVALRSGERWVVGLERVEFPRPSARTQPFKKGGTYVLSGGGGGIGREVARYLLERYDANLLIVGRSAPDDPDRAALLADLGARGGRARYVQLDVCDEPQLRRAVDDVTREWGAAVDGVLHFAAVYAERPLIEETPESLEATWRAKVVGAWALHQIIRNRQDAVFLSFSAVGGFFGGYGASGYAAGNAFVEALAYQQRRSGVRGVCIAWSLWDDMGMARLFPARNAMRARGFDIIGRTKGLASMAAVAVGNEPVVIVGLDESRNYVRARLVPRQLSHGKLVAFVAGNSTNGDTPAAALQLHDPFGAPVACEVRRVAELPQDAAVPDRADVSRDALPRNDLEKTISRVWCDVLKRDSVSLVDNLFDLGGTSLDVAKIAGTLNAALHRPFSKNDIYQHPTIEAQAGFFAGTDAVEPATRQSSSRGDRRRRIAAMRSAGDPR